ncbi:MAG: type I-F CRISPR-associated protein Csy1 [Chlamydiia bacterium]|nr:type I-F CRISPR-associated protein Csy1 [Chlamydiia bacterium]
MEQLATLADLVRGYIHERLQKKLADLDQKIEKNQGQESELAKVYDKREQTLHAYQLEVWMSDAAARASKIQFVTHAPKYTHSASKSCGVWLEPEQPGASSLQGAYLHSGTLRRRALDVFGDARHLDVANLLLLHAGATSLLDEVLNGDSPALRALAPDERTYKEWLDGFAQAPIPVELQSDTRMKQLYFPVGESYHLLGPLYASSLGHQLYQRVQDARFSESSKAARTARRKGEHSEHRDIWFPDLAKQTFGGTKPQNVSRINQLQRGQGYLFSCRPPQWKERPSMPRKRGDFWRIYQHTTGAWGIVKHLRTYLEERAEHSNNVHIRDYQERLVDQLVDLVHMCAAYIQREKGWSQDLSLSRAEQLWLDPHRGETDADFRGEYEGGAWIREIGSQFAAWLNDRLGAKSKELVLGDNEFNEWRRRFEHSLNPIKINAEVK